VTYLGISPRFLQTLLSARLVPRTLTDLSALQNVTSTGIVKAQLNISSTANIC